MTRFKRAIIAVGLSALGGAFCWLRLHTKAIPSDGPMIILSPNSHRATIEMITSADHSTGRTAPPFRAIASDGETYSLADLNTQWPVVLIFIKDGCPCSKSAERYFQQLHTAGGGWVPFFGVINGDETIDASLHLVSRLLGPDAASEAAKAMEYHWEPEKHAGTR